MINNNTIDITERIMHLSRMLRRNPSDHKHHSHGTHRAFAVLMEEDGIRTSDLAERLDIRPSSLTEVIKRLEEQGFVTRIKDENDSRAYRIYATEKAQEEFKRKIQECSEWRERLNASLTEEELSSFCNVCDKLSDFLEKEHGEVPTKKHHNKKHHSKMNHHRGRY